MLVSVVMPVYNGQAFINRSLDSVFSQTYTNYEVICVDDGSTDGTREILTSYGSSLTYLRQSNKGSAAARNLGIRVAKGELIAFLDCDDVWASNKLDLQVDYLRRYPDTGLLHTNIAFEQDGKIIQERLSIAKRMKSASVFEELYLGNFINTSTVMLRKACLLKTGLMDEGLRQAQDYDLWLRIAAQFKIGFIDVVTATYCIHSQNISKNVIGQTACVIQILEKTDTMLPHNVMNVDADKRRERLHLLYHSLAYCHFCRYELQEARRYFLEAVRYGKSANNVYVYILATFSNRRTIESIRALKKFGRWILDSFPDRKRVKR